MNTIRRLLSCAGLTALLALNVPTQALAGAITPPPNSIPAGYPLGPSIVPPSILDFYNSGEIRTSTSVDDPALAPAGSLVGINPTATSSAIVQIFGTWTGTIQFKGSLDGHNFQPVNAVPVGGSSSVNATTGNGQWQVNAGGMAYLQAEASAWGSGVASVLWHTTGAAAGANLAGGSGTPTGTAGAPNASVVSVQGIAGGTLLGVNCTGCAAASSVTINDPTTITQKASVNASGQFSVLATQVTSPWISQIQGAAATGFAPQTGQAPPTTGLPANALSHCVYSTTAPTLTTGNIYICQMDASANMKVAIQNTPTVTANAGSGTFNVAQTNAIPTGTNTIGNVNQLTTTAGFSKILDTAGTNVASVSATNALKVDGSAVTQPVSGTVTANQGTAASVSSAWPSKLVDSGGVNVATVSAGGALKVDNSAITQAISCASGANCPVNAAQWGGTSLGAPTAAGVSATGNIVPIQGVTGGIPIPVSGAGSPLTGGSTAVTTAANQSVGIHGYNGTTLDAIRVAPAGTSVGAAVAGVLVVQGSSNGAALPVSGTITSNVGTGTRPISIASDPCMNNTPTTVAISTAAATTVQLVAISGSTTIYVCELDFMAGGTTNVTLEYGTGALCATGLTALSGAYPLVAQTGMVQGAGNGVVAKTAASNALCIVNSAAVQLSGKLSYVQL